MQSTLHRRYVLLEHARNLLGRESLNVLEDDDLAMALWQREDRRLKHFANLPRMYPCVRHQGAGRDASGFRLVQGDLLRGFADTSTARFDAETPRDLIQPSGKVGIAPELGKASEGGDERLLEDVAGILFGAAHSEAEAEHLLLVSCEDLVDGPRLSAPSGAEKFGIRAGHEDYSLTPLVSDGDSQLGGGSCNARSNLEPRLSLNCTLDRTLVDGPDERFAVPFREVGG